MFKVEDKDLSHRIEGIFFDLSDIKVEISNSYLENFQLFGSQAPI